MSDDINVDDVIKSGTAGDQKKHGSIQEHVAHLKSKFNELMTHGADDPEVYRNSLLTLLHSFETVRNEQDAHIRTYEKRIAWCRSRQEACSMFSSMLVGILSTQATNAKSWQDSIRKVEPPEPKPEPVRDVDVVGIKMCLCACQDEKDAADCDCSCHTEGMCGEDHCQFCKDAPKKAAKKRAAKKKATRKKAVKKLMKTAARK